MGYLILPLYAQPTLKSRMGSPSREFSIHHLLSSVLLAVVKAKYVLADFQVVLVFICLGIRYTAFDINGTVICRPDILSN